MTRRWPLVLQVAAVSLASGTGARGASAGPADSSSSTAPGAAEAWLGALLDRVAADLRAGRPVVAAVHVALCSNNVLRQPQPRPLDPGTRVRATGPVEQLATVAARRAN